MSITPNDDALSKLTHIADLIRENNSFIIMGHQDPDGDAVGSVLALYHILTQMNKEVTILADTPYPQQFQFLTHADKTITKLPDHAHFDITFLCDCGEITRAPKNFPTPKQRGTLVVIDHHATSACEGDFNFNDPDAPAVGFLIYQLAKVLQEKISLDTAKALYCSIVSDTGNFRYQKTTPATMNIAAELIELGVQPWELTSHLFESNPIERQRLLSLALNTIELHHHGKLAYMTILQEMYDKTGGHAELTDGFINFARGIRGVEIAILFREETSKWKLSIRSKGVFDASKLAISFGGGGHHNAAGAVINGNLKEIQELVSQAVKKQLDALK